MLVTDAAVTTGITVILQRGDDRAIVTSPGSIASLGLQHIDLDRVSAAAHVHVGSFFLQRSLRPDVAKVFESVREGGATTSLDTNYDPADQWDLGDVLECCDVLFPNVSEARRFGGSDDLATAAAALTRRVRVVAITLGADGALVASADRVERVAASIVDGPVVDAVGAGDTFDAGFIAGHIKGWDIAQSLRLGLGAASLSVRGRGGTDRQGSLGEAMVAGGCTR
jgi:sugar/nucleoside kinase (ribokinase family)